jgi:CubicO group peptidase (beta-lactamase class C family)
MKLRALSYLLLASCLFSSLFAQTGPDLSQLSSRIRSGDYPAVHSIVISSKGKISFQQYFNGYSADSLHDSRSSFKSITAILIGIAIDKGFIKTVNQPIYTFFPGNKAFSTMPMRRKITIRHLLEMRSGLDCDEWSDNGKDCESEMEKSSNWVNYSLSLPMNSAPGKKWRYTSCNTMIVSGIIAQASGISVMEFAKRYLFDPLGIIRYRWTVDPAGNGMTAGSFYIRPEDMLKIGELVSNKGYWKGKALVSRKWIIESTAAGIPIPDKHSFMQTSRSKVAAPCQSYYGYSWYKEKIKTPKWQYDAVFASGNGGQYIFIIKELDLVVVFTQGNYGSWKAKQAFDILASYIIPVYRKN